MALKTVFQNAVKAMGSRNIPFAVAGGFAAGLYRNTPRLTMDVDLVILAEHQALAIASEIIESLGLRVGIARRADLAGGPLFAIRQKSSRPCMVVGRVPGHEDQEGVDILLPEIPWVREGVRRAQFNPVDFGFGPVPVLTLEDVILSKLYALMAARPRPKDLDDLQSIFEAGHDFDAAYLSGQIQRLDICIPKMAIPFLPSDLLAIIRGHGR